MNKYTVYTYTVCKGREYGVIGGRGPQTDKTPLQVNVFKITQFGIAFYQSNLSTTTGVSIYGYQRRPESGKAALAQHVVSRHNLERSQTGNFCMDFLEEDVLYYPVFLLSPLQCTVTH